MKNLLPVLCSVAMLCLAPTLRAVLPITVTSTADNGPGSLRDAIAVAPSGATINFAVTGAIVLTNGELLINKDLMILGPGPATLAVQRSTASGTPEFRVFHITSGIVVISGLSVNNGRDISGGGIQNEASLVLREMNVAGNVVTNALGSDGTGGGLANSGTLSVYNSVISTNRADGGDFGGSGGGIYNAATLVLTICTISGNTANG